MDRKTLAQAGKEVFSGKRVLVRVDFNVPQNDDLTVADDSRIRAALPTINYLREAGARVILLSHLGRPRGGFLETLSLKPVAKRASELLGAPVQHLSDCVGPQVESFIASMKDSQVCLLENVRFHGEEEKNDDEFSRQLAALADVYVNDAFGTAHRAHASTEGVTRFLRPALAGFLLEKEVKMLGGVLDNPARPFATVIGGAKVSSKIAVLENLLDRVDVLVIGGAMAFTFLKARGLETGRSLVEPDRVEYCLQLLAKAAERKAEVVLPVDVVCAPELKAGAGATIVPVDAIPPDQMGLDLGPETFKKIEQALRPCRTILWNGPLGAFETPGFEKSTLALVDLLADLTEKGARTVIGGGDSVAAIEARQVSPTAFTHVSTGGGASLEFLEGIQLPGIACLDPAESLKAGAQ